MKFTPNNGFALIKPKPSTDSDSAIVIPETVKQEGPIEGEIIAIGKKGPRTTKGDFGPVIFTEGQKVLVPLYAGTKVSFGFAEYMLVKQDDIFGSFE